MKLWLKNSNFLKLIYMKIEITFEWKICFLLVDLYNNHIRVHKVSEQEFVF